MKWHLSRRLGACLLGYLAAVFSAASTAEDYSLVPDAFVYCTTCHGVEFRGNRTVDAPRLNDMEDWYLKSQLLAFKNGYRGTHPEDLIGMEMQPQASALSEQAIDDVVAFVTAVPLRSTTVKHTISGDADRGKTLYATCGACHGPLGRGSKVLNAPALADQNDWYLIRQLAKYQSGARGYAQADTAGTQMRAATAILAGEQDINDVVAYINTLSSN